MAIMASGYVREIESTTVKEYLTKLDNPKKLDIAKSLGIIVEDEKWDGCVTNKIYQALCTNALVYKKIKTLFEWHGDLILDYTWLKTPATVFRLRRCGILEDNIIALFQNGDEKLTDQLYKEELKYFGFSNDQIKKYFSILEKEGDKEKSANAKVPARDRQTSKNKKKKSPRSRRKKINSFEVLRELDLDSIIKPLEENGQVLRYLDRFYKVVVTKFRFSNNLAIHILKTRVPKPMAKFIQAIEQSKVDVTLKWVINTIRKSNFCVKELDEATRNAFFHNFELGMDPKDFLHSITEAISILLPSATSKFKAYILLYLLPEQIKRRLIFGKTSASSATTASRASADISIGEILTLLIQETRAFENAQALQTKNQEEKQNKHENRQENHHRQHHQADSRNYRGGKRYNAYRVYRK